jgi:putative phage-type endonuclease
MGMSREELQARRAFIGSSDVPAILGFDPYRSITDVWLEKTGRTVVEPSTSEPAEFGTAVEPVLIEWAGRKLDLTVTRGLVAHHPTHPFMRAQMDGWVEGANAVVEAKAYGLWNPRWDGRDWGLDGTDEVPYNVMAQVNFQMACATAERAYVVALLGNGMGVRVYALPRNDALIHEVERRCEAFWTDHVVADVPPDAPASLDTLKTVIREPDGMREITHDWPDRWLNLKEQEGLVSAAVADARRAILQEMGDAEVGFTPFGEFSYRANARGVRTFRFHGLPS